MDNRNNKESCWVTESVDADYVNISVYSPLSGTTFIIHCELKNLMEYLTATKINENKCFI